MTRTRTTIGQRIGWAAVGALGTCAALAAGALQVGRALAETERYGTHQRQHPRR